MKESKWELFFILFFFVVFIIPLAILDILVHNFRMKTSKTYRQAEEQYQQILEAERYGEL